MYPSEWSESICIPSFDRSSYRRGTSVCRQISTPGGSTSACRPVQVRRHSGVNYETVLSARGPSAFTETITCFEGRSGRHHRSSVVYSSDSKPTCLLRPSSFFETCYVLPPDARLTSKTTFGCAVESATVPRWYSSTMKVITRPRSSSDNSEQNCSSSLPSDLNNNDGIAGRGRQPVHSETTPRHHPEPSTPAASFRTRLVVNSVSG